MGKLFFVGVLCERVAVSSWGLLLSMLPWGRANVLWQQMKLQPRLRLAAAFFWMVQLQGLLPERRALAAGSCLSACRSPNLD